MIQATSLQEAKGKRPLSSIPASTFSPTTNWLSSADTGKQLNIFFILIRKMNRFGNLMRWCGSTLSLAALLGLPACATDTRYIETHELVNLKVVFLDEDTLHEKWKERTGQPGAEFQPLLTGGMASLKVIKGFYDFTTDTLYCPKWNFEVCGHELHHAALGHFHPPH